MTKTSTRSMLISVGLVGALAFGTSWLGENSPEGKGAQADLVREAAEISKTPGVIAAQPGTGRKLGQASAHVDFRAAGDVEGAVQKVDANLVARGWKRVGTEKLYDWGRDFGEHAINYCRGKYGAQVFIWGRVNHAPGGPDFAVDYWWRQGEDPCKPR